LVILADSSVWIDHIRKPVTPLTSLLAEGRLVMHPFVSGEIALGSIARRDQVLEVLTSLEQLEPVSPDALLDFIEEADLAAQGIGYVDAHLLAATRRAQAELWTRDKRLAAQAERLGLAYSAQV
jgi:predicted nucleic acid-binding protein